MRSPSARIELVIAMVAMAAALTIARGVLESVPHVQDEITYWFQASLLARGRLWIEPSPLPLGIPLSVVKDGRWFGAFPSGWPLVLAPFWAVGVPWLANPLLHGLATWRSGALARALWPEVPHIGWTAALLVGFSPQLLLLGGSSMSHPLVVLLTVLLGERMVRRDTISAGFLVGFALLVRPLCGALLGIVFLLSRPRLISLVPILLAALAQAGINHTLTGSWTTFPVDAGFAQVAPQAGLSPDCNALGFGPTHGCDPAHPGGHTPALAWANTRRNLELLGDLLLGSPALLLVPMVGAWRARRVGAVVIGLLGATVGAYSLYWYDGSCYGARFYTVAVPGLLLLAARGLPRTPLVTVAVAAACVARLALTLPELQGYWGVDGRLADVAAEVGPGQAVLVAADPDHWTVVTPRTGPGEVFEVTASLLMASGSVLPGDVVFLPATAHADKLARQEGRSVWGFTLRTGELHSPGHVKAR